MEPEKAGDRRRIAKRLRRPRVARPPRAAPAAKPAGPAVLAPADLSHLLIDRIRRAQLWMFKDVSRRLAAFEIGPSQFFVLSMIEANPGANQFAIAQSLSINRAGIGRLVDHLERHGLVQRSASAVNRRYYVLYLTEAGAALLGRLRPAIAGCETAIAERIGPRRFREMQRALDRMRDP
ncbi:MarR family transcriptional regulator [Bradyrhizobium diazoefficiens]|nr:MarR family transcriptional regulator [Bradyrhizobium diazoefficiens]MBR0891491.1 MarR family transcriptional regulator [Bradyrhizobium diazoefficiens]MBR0923190.1 MarR family transcriptional regulator [Bradyrhizobium diazoefficiens]